MYSFVLSFFFAYITKENKTFVRIYSKVITGTCDVSYMYRYADPIAGRHEAHLRKATRSGVKSARAKEQVNEIAEATQQSTKSGRLHLSYNDNKNLRKSDGVVNRRIVIAAAMGIIMAKDRE